MSESFILEFVAIRVKQLGYLDHHLRYRDLVVEENSTLEISGYNALWFIVGDPAGIKVESDYGTYDTIDNEADENTYQHRGLILITNTDSEKKRIRFIEAILKC